MITFTIPTWNRADKLEVCLQSLIEQIEISDYEIKIAVYNNGSDDGTDKVLEKYNSEYPEIISYTNGNPHVCGEESHKRAFLMAKTEWLWMFGDDDLLVKDGLKIVTDLIKRKDIEFVHVSEASRSGEPRIYNSTLLDLCQGFGFTEMTGFMSGNVGKTGKIHSVLASDNYSVYKTCSFQQSLILLDAFADSKSSFINSAIIDLQDNEQTAETGQRWLKEDTSRRYVNMADGLVLLREQKRIPDVLQNEFFRYLTGNMFGKIMYNFYEWCLVNNNHISDEDWQRLRTLSTFLPKEERARIHDVINGFDVALTRYMNCNLAAAKALIGVQEAHEPATIESYPFTYI